MMMMASMLAEMRMVYDQLKSLKVVGYCYTLKLITYEIL
jgi:hypothetical protein